jgi:membrane protein
MGTFSAVYGAFATLPILLLWIYLGWVIVLLGAVIAAYAPSLQMRVVRRPDDPAPASRWRWTAGRLQRRASRCPGLTLPTDGGWRCGRTRCRSNRCSTGWSSWAGSAAWTRAAHSATCCWESRSSLLAGPLVEALLLAPRPQTRAFADRTGLQRLTLADLLER